jgi:hypothetical protein
MLRTAVEYIESDHELPMPKQTLQDIDLNDFSERLYSESDRACAVLAAALLDAKLESVSGVGCGHTRTNSSEGERSARLAFEFT